MNWKPINKVLSGAIIGGIVLLVERLVPALHHHLPTTWAVLLPYATAMITAYLVKLEKDLPGNL